ncbi:putative RNA recognition motif domain, nucleotide-binding alpha-beta plait domain superfamily [Helianthus annuus]|nr:putative RNA recognition motif domain, nucleotide-binding alpha-beta plait domain superfamily [Helianthus annuus]KAJ0634050.1 putative RNA recognition motif domain, nucleotide-binding alpha-beta plait domain superfamily [Helianthus annuus]
MAATEARTETDALLPSTPKSPTNVSEIKTVDVRNVSLSVTEKDIWEFFSFSGNIHYIDMKSESETTKHAFVTFKEAQGANTAVLLTGATIGDKPVTVSHVENYQLPAGAPPLSPRGAQGSNAVAQKAEEVVSTMLAKGFVLGKDALTKAKSFDERHQLTSNASATVASIDRKMGLTHKLSMGTAAMNERMKEVNERYQVSETTKSAIAVAEQKANTAGSALMSNKFVSSGAVWVAGAFAAVAKAAEGVGSKTKEKVSKAEEEKERSKTTENEVNEGSKTKENVKKSEEKKEGSKTTESVDKSEGSKTIESVDKSEAKEGSKTTEKVQKAEVSSNKDTTVTPVKPSNDNNYIPMH